MPLLVACINVDKKEITGDQLSKLFDENSVDLGIVLEAPKGLLGGTQKRRKAFGKKYYTEEVQVGTYVKKERLVFFYEKTLTVIDGPGTIDTGANQILAGWRVPAWIKVRKGNERPYKIAGFHAPYEKANNIAYVVMNELTKSEGPLENNNVDVLLADTNQSTQVELKKETRGQAYWTLYAARTVANPRILSYFDRILALPTIVASDPFDKRFRDCNHRLIGITLS